MLLGGISPIQVLMCPRYPRMVAALLDCISANLL